ncbi:TetR/AcrR family transcriptional regulator [Nocardia uniformis]|uniref:TetR/AcrR family transcriptional regulator n=1 Tax=Nocardia uniformis TaxID=53432 RepID=A0A849C0U3_9NOCA|nr:TetR/AcrR family transcriptional regulator [Nocardia uniformis]NNH72383.1 TetR/AcrR family transcriptional regulator [Nocardia uniformis]
MPAPRKFSRDQLQAAALALVDEHGLAGLTMRNLATELGTGAMTIYNYVDGREGLEELVAAAVMSQTSWAETGDGWDAQVAAIAEGMWRAVRAHPHAISLILTRRSFDLATLAPAEALLQALSRSGRSGRDLLVAFRTVSGYVAGFAQAELTSPLSAASPSVVAERIAALPAERFPKLIEIATVAADSDPHDEFRDGLRLILNGLKA